MSKSITFGKLDQLLRSFGVTVTSILNSHVLYEHAASGAALVLRPFDSKEVADQGTLTVVRRTLVDNGLVEASRWEDLLRECSLAS
jgi:hypothetical protein